MESMSDSASARMCAQIDTGSLEREVTAFWSTITGGTATGTYCTNACSDNIAFHLDTTSIG